MLDNGEVLITGGNNGTSTDVAGGELYNPATGIFTTTGSLNTARDAQAAVLLENGTVLIAGGEIQTYGTPLASTEIYDPATGTYTLGASLSTVRVAPAAALLGNGNVLVAGGMGANGTLLSSAELYTPSTLVPAGLQSIQVTPANPSIVAGGSQQLVATGTFSNGTEILASATWSSSDPAIATVSSDVGNHGNAYGVAAGSTTITACTGTVCGSTTLTIPIRVTPTINWPPPASISYGTQLSSTQLDASATWQGNIVAGTFVYTPAAGTVLTPGIKTLSVAFTPLDTTDYTNAAGSVSINVIEGTPPSISAALSPAPNSNGWNNSPVTVSFTCLPGTYPVASCPSPQIVSTEGPNQQVTGTVTDTVGNQQTVTATVNLDMTPPVIVVSSPANQSVVTQAAVTINGTATDALSGTTQVTCGGVTATLSGSAFSCGVTLNVGLNPIVIKATDIAGNVSASKLYLTLNITLPVPTSLTITPNGYNMLVGESDQFSAIDQAGLVRTDATWTVSDTTIATVGGGSSPALTAVAAGQVILTATVGSAAGQATITVSSAASLTEGTLRWSVPPPSGYTVTQIVQAQATWSTPDLYSVATGSGNCLVTALTSDSQQWWTTEIALTDVSNGCNGVPDGSGGLLVQMGGETVGSGTYAFHIIDVYGPTGTQVWRTDIVGPGPQAPVLAVGQDGTVYYTGWMNSGNFGLVSLSADAGIASLLYSLPQGAGTDDVNCNGPQPVNPGGATYWTNPVVGPDGSILAALMVGNFNEGNPGCRPPVPSTSQQTLYLLQIPPVGTPTLTAFKTDSNLYTDWPNYVPQSIIPDGQGGALVAWAFLNPGANQGHVTDVTGTGSTDLLVTGEPSEMVLGDNGLAYVNNGGTVTAFTVGTVSSVWSYNAPANSNGMHIIASSAGGGLVVKTTTSGVDTVVRLDANGNPTTDSWSGNGIDYFISDLWTDITPGGQAEAYSSAELQFSSASYFQPSGQQQGKAVASFNVSNFSTQGSNETTILNDLTLIANWIGNSPSCSSWLQGNGYPSATSYINNVLVANPTLVGHAQFDACTYAFSFTGGTNVPSGTLFTVNDGGGFFQPTPSSNTCPLHGPVPEGPQEYAGQSGCPSGDTHARNGSSA